MFANAIKNTILVLLIILIFHFMIKNHLMDVELRLKNKVMIKKQIESNKINTYDTTSFYVPKKKDDTSIVKIDNSPKPNKDTNDIKHNIENNYQYETKDHTLKDLYEFVYNDEEEKSSFSDVFEETSIKEISKLVKENGDCDIICPQQNSEGSKDFCMNSIDKHVQENNKSVTNDFSKLKGVLGTESKRTTDGFQILYEYDQATSDTLLGFETFESSFMML